MCLLEDFLPYREVTGYCTLIVVIGEASCWELVPRSSGSPEETYSRQWNTMGTM